MPVRWRSSNHAVCGAAGVSASEGSPVVSAPGGSEADHLAARDDSLAEAATCAQVSAASPTTNAASSAEVCLPADSTLQADDGPAQKTADSLTGSRGAIIDAAAECMLLDADTSVPPEEAHTASRGPEAMLLDDEAPTEECSEDRAVGMAPPGMPMSAPGMPPSGSTGGKGCAAAVDASADAGAQDPADSEREAGAGAVTSGAMEAVEEGLYLNCNVMGSTPSMMPAQGELDCSAGSGELIHSEAKCTAALCSPQTSNHLAERDATLAPPFKEWALDTETAQACIVAEHDVAEHDVASAINRVEGAIRKTDVHSFESQWATAVCLHRESRRHYYRLCMTNDMCGSYFVAALLRLMLSAIIVILVTGQQSLPLLQGLKRKRDTCSETKGSSAGGCKGGTAQGAA
jgi:hypothetical protein